MNFGHELHLRTTNDLRRRTRAGGTSCQPWSRRGPGSEPSWWHAEGNGERQKWSVAIALYCVVFLVNGMRWYGYVIGMYWLLLIRMVCFACWTGLKHALGSVWRCFRLGSTCLPQLQAWQRLKAKVSYEETLKSVKDFNSKNRGLAKRMTRPCSRLVRCNIEPGKEDMHEPPFESHFTWRTSLYKCWIVLSLFSCLWGYRKKGIYCPLDLTWFDWIAAVTSPVLSQTERMKLMKTASVRYGVSVSTGATCLQGKVLCEATDGRNISSEI